jgi:hypothetical protein
MVLVNQKAIIDSTNIGSTRYRSRGLRTRHAMKEEEVNVGDPDDSHQEGVSTDKPKQRGS